MRMKGGGKVGRKKGSVLVPENERRVGVGSTARICDVNILGGAAELAELLRPIIANLAEEKRNSA